MSEMTLAEMAREIERRRPGTLPKVLRFDAGVMVGPPGNKVEMLTITRMDAWNQDAHIWIPDSISNTVLVGAMVIAIGKQTGECSRSDRSWINEWNRPRFAESDAAHGGCATRALFAAFCAVFPEPTP